MVRTSCKQQDAAVPQRWIAAGATIIFRLEMNATSVDSFCARRSPPRPCRVRCDLKSGSGNRFLCHFTLRLCFPDPILRELCLHDRGSVTLTGAAESDPAPFRQGVVPGA